MKPSIKPASIALACTLLAAPLAAIATTSAQLCEDKVDAYVFPEQIRDSATSAARAITSDDIHRLGRVLRSQCMLSPDELARNWDGRSEAEREAFFSNYARIRRVVTPEIYDGLFPNRAAAYTLDSFLRSAVAFPALCDEPGQTDETCAREFATMFAHWQQETSGLSLVSEGSCATVNTCSTYLDAWFADAGALVAEPEAGHKYFGRGPKQLSYNGNYGRFSWQYRGDLQYLERPDTLIDAKGIKESFISAFWFYMTPMSQKPSMHEVVTGLWVPNDVDRQVGIVPGFGATIAIINGALECGKGSDTPQAANRIAFYQGGEAQGQPTAGTLAAFGLAPLPDEKVSCKDFGTFPLGGAGTYPLYFNLNAGMCELYPNESIFSIYDQKPFRALGWNVCANGRDCCEKTVARWFDKSTWTLNLPTVAPSGAIPLDQFVKGLVPWIDIEINDHAPLFGNSMDTYLANTVSLPAGATVTFDLLMEPRQYAGTEGEWFLLVIRYSDASREDVARWWNYDTGTASWRELMPDGETGDLGLQAGFTGPFASSGQAGWTMPVLPGLENGHYGVMFGVSVASRSTWPEFYKIRRFDIGI